MTAEKVGAIFDRALALSEQKLLNWTSDGFGAGRFAVHFQNCSVRIRREEQPEQTAYVFEVLNGLADPVGELRQIVKSARKQGDEFMRGTTGGGTAAIAQDHQRDLPRLFRLASDQADANDETFRRLMDEFRRLESEPRTPLRAG